MENLSANSEPFVRFQDWTGGRLVQAIGTNAGTSPLPFQTWHRFKEAFAPEIVERALSETPGVVRLVADPFGGSGTTALAAQFLGIRPTMIEVNPFLADLIEAKVATVNLDAAAKAFGQVTKRAAERSGPKLPVFSGAPATFVEPGCNGRYIFSRRVARRLLVYREAIATISDPAIQRLFRVVLAATTVSTSNVVVSGKGRRYRQRWTERQRPPELVDELFSAGVLKALSDLRRYEHRKCRDYTLLRGDARVLAAEIRNHDLAVFSPPYPNSFDYTDVYNIELWVCGYLKGNADNTRLRHATMRSHVQLLRDFGDGGMRSTALKETVEALQNVRSRLWNRHIPEMIGGYAADLALIMARVANGLRARGRAYVVVGDSRYAGIDVPVAKILSEMSHPLGFKLISMEPSRSMRSSPQQGGRPELGETLVVLQKK